MLEPYIGESNLSNEISRDWRFQQKWAMFYVTLCDRFVPHPGLTEAALRWALERHNVKLSEKAIGDVMSQYHKLRAYPDVPDALRKLKSLGLKLKIVANPTKQMLLDHTEYAGIQEYFDDIISSGEEVRAFKPSPKVFSLGVRKARCKKSEVLWVTGHFWEITGADTHGLDTAWTNRARQPVLPIGVTPTYTVPNLAALANTLTREQRAGSKG